MADADKKPAGKPEARATSRNWYGKGEQAPGKNEADAAATVSEPEDAPTRHRREREEAWGRHDNEISDMRKRHAKELDELLERHSAESGVGPADDQNEDE